jgi:hypothetical protein
MARLIDWFRALRSPDSAVRVEFAQWYRENGYWYLTSAVVHAIGFVLFALVIAFLPAAISATLGASVTIESAQLDPPDTMPTTFPIGEAPLEPTRLDLETIAAMAPAGQTAKYFDDSKEFEDAGGGMKMEMDGPQLGGLGGFRLDNMAGIGGLGGVGTASGEGTEAGVGKGGAGGFGDRGKGHRDGIPGMTGMTSVGERAVGGGLHWLARHQLGNGNWSIQQTCKGCNGSGATKADAAATALALLPFLGAGQTHKVKGPYQRQVSRGITWLIRQQGRDGDLSGGAAQPMYSHGLATIALCECYGLSKDPAVGEAARKAIQFIQLAQNQSTGGWRYKPGDAGDTSVTGWQMMALKSGQMAELGVDSLCLENVRKWLGSVEGGEHHGLFLYQPYDSKGVTPTMTAVGLLCHQYLGMAKDDPAMLEGKAYLMKNLPDPNTQRNCYYWYYATMMMHNLIGPDWDTWNRAVRKSLISTQVNAPDECANGSWDPEKPISDTWGAQGGRLMVTSLSVLTLEVHYRYLPLYKINTPPSYKAAGLAGK